MLRVIWLIVSMWPFASSYFYHIFDQHSRQQISLQKVNLGCYQDCQGQTNIELMETALHHNKKMNSKRHKLMA